MPNKSVWLSSQNFYTRLLLQRLSSRRNNRVGEAFTLIELMIVVAIIGILAAIAIPNFIEARDSAKVSSRIGEASGFAKACAVWQGTEIGIAPSVSSGDTPSVDGVSGTCATTSTTFTAKWGNARAKGVSCLAQRSENTHATATFTVASSQISCSFS